MTWENGRSLPVLCLILSQNCTTHCEICNVPIERGERREGGKGRGKGRGKGGGRGRGKGGGRGRGKGGREREKKEVGMHSERSKNGDGKENEGVGTQGKTYMWQSCVEIKVFCRFIRHSCIYEAHMSPALNRSSAIWRFEHSNAIEIHDGITFDFYTGLLYMYV